MNEILYKILTSRHLKTKEKGNYVTFFYSGHKVKMHKKIASLFLRQIKSKRYSLIPKMIDIYKDVMHVNF